MGERRKVLDLFRLKDKSLEEWTEFGIENYRKGKGAFTVTDAEGKPIPGAKIELRQTSHDFKVGANLFMLEEFPSQEQNEAYKKMFADCFNIATLPFYWNDMEPEKGKPRYGKDSPRIYRRPVPDLCLEYCEANGIMPKAHCLNYSTYLPNWLKNQDIPTEKYYLEKRFAELAERYAGRIRDWEVTNETFYSLDKRSLFYSDPEFVEWSFKLADRYFRRCNRLIINEAHSFIWGFENRHANRSTYFMQIERALNKGCRIDSVGMQFHMFYRREDEIAAIGQSRFYDPQLIHETLDLYRTLGIPSQITELTIPAYSNDAEDEEIQAEIIRILYTLWFAHPAMEAIIYWNLVDGFAAFAPQGDMTTGENAYYGGLVRYDFTPKPAYNLVKKLFHETWHTQAQIFSDEDGNASFKGFYGDYDAVATLPDGSTESQALHLAKSSHNRFSFVF